ncbi:hypothetical protein ABZ639_06110 [Saccharomonospora sp. NPDC006951]
MVTIVVAAAATGLVGLAGCADRPNDLDTYYDDPEETAAAPAAPGSPSGTAEVERGPEPGVPSPELVAEAERAVLAEADVQGEGVVRAAGPAPHPPGTEGGGAEGTEDAEGTANPAEQGSAGAGSCLPGIPAGLGRLQPELIRWDYPTGSALTQFVTAYPDRPAGDVLSGGALCEGEPVSLEPVDGADAHAAWCGETSCAVVLTRGSVLSGIEVTASDRQRAVEALQRLTPVAASVLAGQP